MKGIARDMNKQQLHMVLDLLNLGGQKKSLFYGEIVRIGFANYLIPSYFFSKNTLHLLYLGIYLIPFFKRKHELHGVSTLPVKITYLFRKVGRPA